MTHSDTAIRLGIPNDPNKDQIMYLERLMEYLDGVREEFANPIIVRSGLRVPKLNKAVGGVGASCRHRTPRPKAPEEAAPYHLGSWGLRSADMGAPRGAQRVDTRIYCRQKQAAPRAGAGVRRQEIHDDEETY